MMEICPRCGLPKPACICDQIQKISQRIRIANDKKRYGKIVTLVSGFDNSIDIKKIAKQLKSELACGGTVKNRIIELQGEHTKKIKPILVKLGFDEESIE
ncbi:stress response translation initiation inhibitor YciH [Candidatus Pacearchaeota archaeon]|nr:stress response translation initiation inhibitor YciH [Candidatus Pacearchaeota archaeon]